MSHYKLPTPLVLGIDYLRQNKVELMMKPTEGENFVEIKINGESVGITSRGNEQRVTVIQIKGRRETKNNEETKNKEETRREEGETRGNDVIPKQTTMECWGLPQNGYIRASLLECVKVIPSSAGYVTLTTL